MSRQNAELLVLLHQLSQRSNVCACVCQFLVGGAVFDSAYDPDCTAVALELTLPALCTSH